MLDLLFWLSLLYWSLVPATKTPWVDIASIPVNSKDIVLVVVSCLCLLVAIINNRQSNCASRPRNWHCYLPILTVLLLIYAGFTMVFYDVVLPQGTLDVEPMGDRTATAMKFTLIFSAASFFLGYILIAKKSPDSVRSFLWRLTICLAGLGIFYSVATLSGTEMEGVRSEMNAAQNAYGGIRVSGPLYGASTGYFFLVPALAFSIQEFFRDRTQRLFKLSIIFALMLAILFLGSRAALLILGIFFVFLSFSMKNKKQAIATIVLLTIIISAAAGLFFSKISSDRLNSFKDSARSETHLISFKIINHRDIEFNIVGSGYGSYWFWYLEDLDNGINSNISLAQTRFGNILYHPHSVFLLLIVELGIFGWLYFISLWIILVRLLIRNVRGAAFPIFNCGVVASGFSIFFDFFIFKGPQINALWWIFLFAALALDSNVSLSKPNNYSLTKQTKNASKISTKEFIDSHVKNTRNLANE